MARANGRIAPAARALGVHRNTVLYRLRAVRAQGGPDPRLPEDALRILSGGATRALKLCRLHNSWPALRAHLPVAGRVCAR